MFCMCFFWGNIRLYKCLYKNFSLTNTSGSLYVYEYYIQIVCSIKITLAKPSRSRQKMTHKFINNCDRTIFFMCNKSQALKDELQYEKIKLDLKFLIGRYSDNVKIHLFGSRIIGLAKVDSDLDIFVEIGNFKRAFFLAISA